MVGDTPVATMHPLNSSRMVHDPEPFLEAGRCFMAKVIGAALSIILLTSTATADNEACRGATYVFKSARESVGDYLRRYASCLSRSNGHNDCSTEFSRLR